MKKFLLAVLLAAALFTACDKAPYQPVPVEGAVKNYDTVFLFEVEGVRVFRFWDKSEWRYLAIGGQVSSRNSRTTRAGKTTTTTHWDGDVIYVSQGEDL
jgi:hypothetical protein